MENLNQEQLEANYHLLKSYQWENIDKPKVILRKLHGEHQHDMDFDDLHIITLDINDPNENIGQKLPQDFKWALQSLRALKKSYKRILEDENERIHLQGLAQKNSFLVIENIAPQTAANSNNGSYIGGCTEINGRPCIMLVSDKFKDTTLLHEAVHHSDLMLGTPHFSDLPIYQTIIMMIDAQISSSGKNNKTVRSLRNVNKYYNPGQLYIEGLPWITELPFADLYQEKNHLGQSLKLLHAGYTKALLEGHSATVLCYRAFKPQKKLLSMLEEYNKNAQQIGNNRRQILNQQKDFTNELLLFRREIGTIERTGLGTVQMPEGIAEFCDICGFKPLTSAIMAYHNAQDLVSKTKDNPASVISTVQKLQSNINVKDLKNSSADGKNILTAAFYLQMIDDYQNGLGTNLVLADIPPSLKQKSADELRTKLYNNITQSASLTILSCQSGCSKRDCELAQALQTTPKSVQLMREKITYHFANMADLAQKREAVLSYITDFELNPDINEAHQAQIKAALAMENFLSHSVCDIHIHGALSYSDLQHFDVSKKILQDMRYFKLSKNSDGLTLNAYKNFDLGYVSELFNREASCFNQQSSNYIPNDYKSTSPEKTNYARALYELLSARHRSGLYASKDLTLAAFRPSPDFYSIQSAGKPDKTYS